MNKLISTILILAFFASCKPEKNDQPSPVENKGSVEFYFNHNVDGDSLVFDEYNYVNAAGNEYQVNTLKYYISRLIIYNENGDAFDVNMYKLINAAETNSAYQKYTLGNVPAGTYNKVSFIFGIDTSRNRFLGLGNNQEDNTMAWPEAIGGGYHFMQLEGGYKKTVDTIRFYAIHLGKTPNQVDFNFTVPNFVVSANGTVKFSVDMNVNNWFKLPNQIDFRDDYSYIMENDAQQTMFKQNAANVFSVHQIMN